MTSEDKIDNAVLAREYEALMKRGTSPTDPRVKAIKRIAEKQKMSLPKGNFPAQLTFPVKK